MIFYLALAGAVGALARWGFSGWLAHVAPNFPWGTLGENLIGCFLIGLLMEGAERSAWMTAEWRTVLAVGFIGTFTTFSTFEFETFRLAQSGDFLHAGWNAGLNLVAGFVLVWLGTMVAAGAVRVAEAARAAW